MSGRGMAAHWQGISTSLKGKIARNVASRGMSALQIRNAISPWETSMGSTSRVRARTGKTALESLGWNEGRRVRSRAQENTSSWTFIAPGRPTRFVRGTQAAGTGWSRVTRNAMTVRATETVQVARAPVLRRAKPSKGTSVWLAARLWPNHRNARQGSTVQVATQPRLLATHPKATTALLFIASVAPPGPRESRPRGSPVQPGTTALGRRQTRCPAQLPKASTAPLCARRSVSRRGSTREVLPSNPFLCRQRDSACPAASGLRRCAVLWQLLQRDLWHASEHVL